MFARTIAIILIASALALAACGDSGDGDDSAKATPPAEPVTPARTAVNLPTLPPDGFPAAGPTATPFDGTIPTGVKDADVELPPGIQDSPLNRTTQILADEVGARFDQIEVLSVVPQAWPDACLGLPERGETCAQVVTPGLRIVLVLGDFRYTYRTDEAGANIRLEKVEDFSGVFE